MQALLGSLLFRCVLWAVLAAMAGGAYLAFKQSIADAATTQTKLDDANASLALARKARDKSDAIVANLKKRDVKSRGETNVLREQVNAMADDCLNAPVSPELDKLLYLRTHEGVTDRTREAAANLAAATRRKAVGAWRHLQGLDTDVAGRPAQP